MSPPNKMICLHQAAGLVVAAANDANRPRNSESRTEAIGSESIGRRCDPDTRNCPIRGYCGHSANEAIGCPVNAAENHVSRQRRACHDRENRYRHPSYRRACPGWPLRAIGKMQLPFLAASRITRISIVAGAISTVVAASGRRLWMRSRFMAAPRSRFFTASARGGRMACPAFRGKIPETQLWLRSWSGRLGTLGASTGADSNCLSGMYADTREWRLRSCRW
jgi:hypothetical protein